MCGSCSGACRLPCCAVLCCAVLGRRRGGLGGNTDVRELFPGGRFTFTLAAFVCFRVRWLLHCASGACLSDAWLHCVHLLGCVCHLSQGEDKTTVAFLLSKPHKRGLGDLFYTRLLTGWCRVF